MSRKTEIKSILEGIKDGTLDADKAASSLADMFSAQEKQFKKAQEDLQGTVDSQKEKNVTLKVEYESLTDVFKNSVTSVKGMFEDVFSSYRNELQSSLSSTQELIPILNKITSQQVETFAEFKGMSVDAIQAGDRVSSLFARVQEDLLGLYTPDEIRKGIVETTSEFQRYFPQIRFESKETEKALFETQMRIKKLGTSGETAAKFLQATTSVQGEGPEGINRITNGLLALKQATGQPLDEAIKNYNHFTLNLGYSAEKAFQATKKLAVQQQMTGIGAEELGQTFGRSMDTFDDLANTTAELNAAFGISLNPQEMIDMTADERMEYIQEAIRESGADLDDRLLRRAVEGRFGGAESTNKFLGNISKMNESALARARETQKKVAEIRLADQATSTQEQEKQAKAQMSTQEKLQKARAAAAQKGRVAAAGGGTAGADQIESDAYLGFKAKAEAELYILNQLTETRPGQAVNKLFQSFRRAQALLGDTLGGVIGTFDVTKEVSAKSTLYAREKLMEAQKTRKLTPGEQKFLDATKGMEGLTTKTYTQAYADLVKGLGKNLDAKNQAFVKKIVENQGMPEDVQDTINRTRKDATEAADKTQAALGNLVEKLGKDWQQTMASFKQIDVVIKNMDWKVLAKGVASVNGSSGGNPQPGSP